ncbi:2-aminoethylphosphonate--pyruvate transaminase [Amphritea sp. 2_MG-2023]|uniref:2-aminoethylphosphonate--pyruvate transaminase n=1 Tax=Amphritea TaxID=515417 RepID=UPI001C07A310|nr:MULTISPECIES: 2-aminoethylphosphonate--pyruvate transaminase [Amphritea]MBU2964112.1 2-aminoethylphosphonate--pyruvate transaminase [Amphritea atlantica]MDO6418510.1 2-aminoethylphosphonate--pyruvate transaminase [Amphritea sp. 2_MG-2023]
MNAIPDNPYLLLTPGPLSTSPSVRQAMMKDWCTWDQEYNQLVNAIRERLVTLALPESHDVSNDYTCVLMQGSGSASVESVIGSVIPNSGKLLVLANGTYGKRIGQIADVLSIDNKVWDFGEQGAIDLAALEQQLSGDHGYSHVAVVHCETTTGRLNPIEQIAKIVKKTDTCLIVDAMSSFGGVPIDVAKLEIDFLISSANKCIQGVPGFGFIIAKRSALTAAKGFARSLSLDLYDQWTCMEEGGGKWRFTSPTHTVRAFDQALIELEQEGGINARYQRYQQNHKVLVDGMRSLGFKTMLNDEVQSPFITTFYNPTDAGYQFQEFYRRLKLKGFVIYPGKVSDADCFRIGNIGHVFPDDMERLIKVIDSELYWLA